jgi:uroporphyrinogen decarboxylase
VRQIEYAKKITDRFGDEVATFYNIFCAGTILKFMQPDLAASEEFLASLVREDKEAVREAFDVISSDIAKLAVRLVKEANVTGIYFSLQNLIGEGIDRAVYDYVFAPGEKKVLAAVKEVSDYNILHICGYAGHRNDLSWYTDYDVKAVNWAAVVEGIPLEEGRKLFPNKALIGGFCNLPSSVLYKGSKAEIQAETKRIIENAGRVGVILGADCTVPRDTDWQHFEWVREAAK